MVHPKVLHILGHVLYQFVRNETYLKTSVNNAVISLTSKAFFPPLIAAEPAEAELDDGQVHLEHLPHRPRAVLRFPWGLPPAKMTAYVDSDFAGCTSTRKSTSGGVVFWGETCLKSWSKTQGPVALSSAEAECYALVKGLVEGFGLQSLLQELGWFASV